MNERRIEAARAEMAGRGVDALVLTIGSDLPYLTGYRAMENERITALVVPAVGEPVMVVPVLEEPRVNSAVEIRPWEETDDPLAIIAGLIGEAETTAIGDQTWSRFLLGLEGRLPETSFVPAEAILAPLRIVKDDDEIAALRAAGSATDRVVARLSEIAISGTTERELARLVDELTIAEGHQRTAHAIVASGPNGASPHHEPSDRVIEPGDAVVIDFGGWLDGYGSDTTRTFVVGESPDGFDEAFEVLGVSQRSAVEAVKPGAAAESIDAVARGIIEDAGYGDLFIHRTGHGIGLDIHEPPYLVAGNATELRPGMTFSIEPGIYAAGRWGMRIEDIVAVTEDGVERLNQSDRRLYRVG